MTSFSAIIINIEYDCAQRNFKALKSLKNSTYYGRHTVPLGFLELLQLLFERYRENSTSYDWCLMKKENKSLITRYVLRKLSDHKPNHLICF